MFSGMDSGSQMEIVKALSIGVISRHSAAHFTTLHLRKSRLREPDLGTMKDNAGKWNRDEQFCVFSLRSDQYSFRQLSSERVDTSASRSRQLCPRASIRPARGWYRWLA